VCVRRRLYRQTDDGTVEYSDLYYRCNRVLADLFYAGDTTKRQLEFCKRNVVVVDANRHVSSRLHSTVLADLFDVKADESVKHQSELSEQCVVLSDVSRHVQPRSHADRRTLKKLPVFIYNSAPESGIIDEFKDKVYSLVYSNTSAVLMASKLHSFSPD